VKNVRFSNVGISGETVGAVCGTATGSAKIYNCGVLGGSVSGSTNAGGLVGLIAAGSNVRVVNCYNYAAISGGDYAAGIVGCNQGTISGTTTVNTTGVRIKGSITVNIEETGCHPIVIGELYGCGNKAPYAVPAGSTKQPTINIRSFTSIGKVFGGGLGETAIVTGNPTVTSARCSA